MSRLLAILITLSFLSGCIESENANSWAFKLTQIDKLHSLGLNGNGVRIAILDTGVNLECEELKEAKIVAWKDMVENRSKPYDDDGHGTYITALLLSKSSFSIGNPVVKGICPLAEAVIVKIRGRNKECTDGEISQAVRFCIKEEVDIILLSDPKARTGKLTEEACREAISKGIFVIVPAGDDGCADDGDVNFLPNVSEAISVGSIGKDLLVSSFSSRGNQAEIVGVRGRREDPNKKPELVAPGECMVSIYREGIYVELSSTSEAAAMVAGIVALLLQAYSGYEKSEESIKFLKEVLAKTAKKLGGNELYSGEPFSHNDKYGYGLVQAYDAYVELGKYWRR